MIKKEAYTLAMNMKSLKEKQNENEIILIKELKCHRPFNSRDKVLSIKRIVDQELKEGNSLDLLFLKKRLNPMVTQKFRKPLRNYFDLRILQVQLLREKYKMKSLREVFSKIDEYEAKVARERLKSANQFINEIRKWEDIFQDLFKPQDQDDVVSPPPTIPISIPLTESEEDPLHRK